MNNTKPPVPRALSSNYPYGDLKYYMRQVNYGVLKVKVGDDNLSNIKCLEPQCCTRTDEMESEKRKAYWVTFLLNLVGAGVSVDELPYICNCETLPCSSAESYLETLTIDQFEVYA